MIREMLTGLGVTLRQMLMKPVTVQYPEEKPAIPERYRGRIVLTRDPSGEERCVACYLCSSACPVDCITIYPAETSDEVERYPEIFDIDMSRCMFCGLCEEACPEEAIVMSREVELATFDRESMLFDKEKLLDRRLGFLRSEYDRVHALPEKRG